MRGCHSPGVRPDHRAGIKLAAIDPHRAAEAAADLKGGFDDRVAREARRDRFEIGDFTGRAAAGHSVSSSLDQGAGRKAPLFDADKRSGLPAYCLAKGAK
jgi:hypothetical protein